jgi:hypothetical protein
MGLRTSALAALALCAGLGGCLHRATPEEAQRMILMGQALKGAGTALQAAPAGLTDGVHTYILNGRVVTCTTASTVTTCT